MANIEKRGEGRYRITVSAGYDINGQKIRKHKTVTLDGKLPLKLQEKELQKLAAEFERQVETGQYLDGGKVTFKEFTDIWLRDYATTQLQPKTLFNYKDMLMSRILPELGHLQLRKIQPVHLIEFYNKISESGIRRDKKYIAKQELIEKINVLGKRKGINEFSNASGISVNTVSNICHGKKVQWRTVEKTSTFFGINARKLFTMVEKDMKLSSNSILHYHQLISSILTSAVQWQAILSNPSERVKPPKVRRREAAYYNEDQVEHMLDLLEKEDIRLKTAIYLVVFVGLRLGELSGLEWKDLDFKNNLIKIERASQYLSDKQKAPDERINTKDPKTDSGKRNISISPIVATVLNQYKAWQNKERLKLGDKWQRKDKDKYGEDYDCDRIFIKWDGSPIFPETPSKWFAKFREKYNLPKLSFHGLRHTNASLLISQGTDITTVGKRLGHSSSDVTMRTYAHALKRPDKEAAEKLENLFNKKTNKSKQA